MRIRPLALWMALATLGLSVGPTTAAAAREDSGEKLTVLLLPAQAFATGAGLSFTPATARNWSAATQRGLDSGLRQAVDASPRLHGIHPPTLAPAENAAITEFVAVATRAVAQAAHRGTAGGTNTSPPDIPITLGPSLAFLHDRTGADYALGAIGARLQPGYDVFTALSVNPYRVEWKQSDNLPVSFNYVALYLIHLQTGHVVWTKDRNGYQVVGLKSINLHDTQAMRETAVTLLHTLPELSSPVPTAIDTTTEPPSKRATSPVQGEFAVRMPEGWKVSNDDHVVSATADGKSLDVMQVELRDHSGAFPATAQQSTRTSTPVQLAQWYLADLQRRHLIDFNVIETASSADMAGMLAFRLHFSYRLPASQGSVRVEQITIGAAVSHGLLLSHLAATELLYFAKALPAFEESTATIALKPRRHLQ